MTALLQAILPLPPGINASYKTGKGKFYGSPELHAFKQEAHARLYQQRELFNWTSIHHVQQSKHKTPLAIVIDFYYPTRWKKDIDGGEKAVIDAIFVSIGLNDNLIVDKHTRKLVDRNNPRCEVQLYVFQEEAA